MSSSIFIKRFFYDKEKITIEIKDIEDNDEIIINNQYEFIKYIQSSYVYFHGIIDNRAYEVKNVLKNVSNFFDKVNNVVEKQPEIFQTYFLNEVKKLLDQILIEVSVLRLNKNELFNEDLKLVGSKLGDLNAFVSGIKEDFFHNYNRTFTILEYDYNSDEIVCHCHCYHTWSSCKNSAGRIREVIEKDLEKLKDFVKTLFFYKTKDKHCHKNNVFFGSNDNKLICTLVNDFHIKEKDSDIVSFKDYDSDVINIKKNKQMYDIIKKILEANERNAAIFNTNMREKINAISFYYRNPDILDLCIDLNKKEESLLTFGDFFNCLRIRQNKNKPIKTIILADPSEIHKFKDEIKNEDTIIYLFFTKESAKYFNFEYLYSKYHKSYYIKIYFKDGEITKYIKKIARNIYSYFRIRICSSDNDIDVDSSDNNINEYDSESD